MLGILCQKSWYLYCSRYDWALIYRRVAWLCRLSVMNRENLIIIFRGRFHRGRRRRNRYIHDIFFNLVVTVQFFFNLLWLPGLQSLRILLVMDFESFHLLGIFQSDRCLRKVRLWLQLSFFFFQKVIVRILFSLTFLLIVWNARIWLFNLFHFGFNSVTDCLIPFFCVLFSLHLL